MDKIKINEMEINGVLIGARGLSVETDKSDYDIVCTLAEMERLKTNGYKFNNIEGSEQYGNDSWGDDFYDIFELYIYGTKINLMCYKKCKYTEYKSIMIVLNETKNLMSWNLNVKEIRIKIFKIFKEIYLNADCDATILIDRLILK